ncbi:MAG: hypothetical protein ACREAU_03755 [Nitrosopumilaceae archaeon]
MIKFISLSLRNFLTYGDVPTIIPLDRQGTILVVGENGVGKTAWLNALTYVLYDEPISKIPKDELINNINKKNLEVIVEFEKDQHYYKIIRARKFKTTTGNFVQLFEDGKELTLDSAAHTNAKILEIINIPYELFIRIVAFPATLTPFLDLPARGSGANQMEIIEELFDLKTLSEKAEKLKELTKATDTAFQLEEQKITQLRAEHERYQQQLALAKERVVNWETDNEAKKTQLKTTLHEIKKINIEKQKKLYEDIDIIRQALNDINVKIGKAEFEQQKIDQLKKAHLIRISQIETAKQRIIIWDAKNKDIIIDLKREINEINKINIEEEKLLYNQITEVKRVLEETKNEISLLKEKLLNVNSSKVKRENEQEQLKSNKCPYCLQNFPGSSEKLHSVNHELEELKKEIKTVDAQISKFNKKLTSQIKSYETFQEAITTDSLDTLHQISEQRTSLKKQLNIAEQTQNPYIEPLRELTADQLTDITIEELDKKNNEIQENIIIFNNALNHETNKYDKQIQQLSVSSFDELLKLSEEQALLQQQLKMTEQSENPFFEPYEELVRNKIEQPNPSTINNLNVELEHQRFLYKLLTKKDSFVRKGLLDKNLTYLNRRLSLFLHELEFNFTVEFTHDMGARISKHGRELGFGNLSTGQKARVNLALSFAFRDVLQSLHDKTNICILDETLDYGLDTRGVPIAAMMIKQKAKEEGITLFIVSHRDEVKGIFDKTMTISLVDDFTTISE